MQASVQFLQKNLQTNRVLFDDLVKRKFIFTQTAEIYGGVAGLYDYGPIGTGIKNNLIQFWKSHFIIEDDLLEISCTTLTPQVVLKYSGHEERFIDYMVKDNSSGETFRVDHLIEDFIERELKEAKPDFAEELNSIRRKLPNFKSGSDFDAVVEKYNLKNPTNKKGNLSKAFPFNLMFECKVGPMGDQKAYLRPETAQSIFCNFKKLLDFNNGKLPFGASIVGSAYRNEIAPRNGLLRVREFEMAEIEFFVDPESTLHPKFDKIKNKVLPIYSREFQQSGADPQRMTLSDAMEKKILKNQTLAYFLARTYAFAVAIGLHEDMLRFRQHQSGEMAHYASDCWDLEVLTSYGWVECVGLADRAAYDLTAHTKGSGEKLVASRLLKEPKAVIIKAILLNKAILAKVFKADSQKVISAIDNLTEAEVIEKEAELEKNGKFTIGEFEVTKEMIKEIKSEKKNVQEEKFVPAVIEPSFGIGRLTFACLEHAFRVRDDKKRTYLNIKPVIAPYKVVFLPLMSKDNLNQKVEELVEKCRLSGVSCRADCGGSAIGKRYARTDEVGIPFAVTVDYETLEKDTVTLREIESMDQIRVPCGDLLQIVADLLNSRTCYKTLLEKYPKFESKDDDKNDDK